MHKTQHCPVCGKEQIPQDRQKCPQCNADLTCFQVLDALSEHEAGKPAQKRMPMWLKALLALFILTGMGWMLHQNVMITQTLRSNQEYLKIVDRSVQTLMRKVEQGEEGPAQSRPDQSGPTQSSRPAQSRADTQPDEDRERLPAEEKEQTVTPLAAQFFWYETTDTDTLWGISERFYQSGRYYPVLLVMNPQIDIYKIKAGQRLKILENPKDAVSAFNRSVERQGQYVYLWYQVQAGDTPVTLSSKFYKSGDQFSTIQRMNPDLHLEPGQRIKVLLPDLS
ncbi:MAG: LysM peptidoglycan-binding domain-containing protein [bacterium]